MVQTTVRTKQKQQIELVSGQSEKRYGVDRYGTNNQSELINADTLVIGLAILAECATNYILCWAYGSGNEKYLMQG